MKPTVEEICAKADEILWEIDRMNIGVRSQEQPFELGPISHTSVVWDDGDETDEELDGICVTCVDWPSVSMHSRDHWAKSYGYYPGEHVALIAYDEYEWGEDVGEHVAKDAEVVYIFC